MKQIHHVPAIEAAVEQLDWTIRLFLDFKAAVPAITLAGAAEEILGKLNVECKAGASAYESVGAALSAKGYQDPQGRMNVVRNFLKHLTHPTLEVDLESEALQMLLRAIINLFRLDGSLSSESPRLLEWIRLSRLDLQEYSAN